MTDNNNNNNLNIIDIIEGFSAATPPAAHKRRVSFNGHIIDTANTTVGGELAATAAAAALGGSLSASVSTENTMANKKATAPAAEQPQVSVNIQSQQQQQHLAGEVSPPTTPTIAAKGPSAFTLNQHSSSNSSNLNPFGNQQQQKMNTTQLGVPSGLTIATDSFVKKSGPASALSGYSSYSEAETDPESPEEQAANKLKKSVAHTTSYNAPSVSSAASDTGSVVSIQELQAMSLSPTGKAITPTPAKKKKKLGELFGKAVSGGDFEAEKHFYPRVLNAHIHPLVSSFLSLGNERILARYTHLNPQVNIQVLKTLLTYKPKYFQWAGSDLFNVTTSSGHRQMIIVETNSCPSGQKSMPLLSELGDDHGGYGVVIDNTFKEMIGAADKSLGDLAVVYDKNGMEASGYAAVLAESTKETVWLVEYYDEDPDPPVRWNDGVMYIRDVGKAWHPIRACFRYVTQKPWNRFPINSKTIVLNSVVSCLAGGRNKMMAARAYDFLNAELDGTGLSVRIPETIRNVTKSEIPLWLDSMGGHAVLKVPYSNAGQGVYTITNKEELKQFMDEDHHYDKFIVQSLVGNASWSSITRAGKFYHVGTIPNKKNHTFVSDLRMMVTANASGFRPVAIYARRARKPLLTHLSDDPSITSWEMLGTNLSVKVDDEWTTEAQRLLLMDRKDFNQLGIGIDDLIDAYIQTVLSVIAIDKMACRLMKENDGRAVLPTDPKYPWHNQNVFDFELFEALNPDVALLQEIMH